MKIGELARRSGVSASRIRFYEEQGLLPPADRALNGYRDYGEETAARLETISLAQRLGFSLAEIKRITPGTDGPSSTGSVLSHLKDKLASVEQHLAETLALRQRLRAAIELFEDAGERGVVCGGVNDDGAHKTRCISEAIEPDADDAASPNAAAG